MLLFVLVFRLITLPCAGGVSALVEMTFTLVEITFALVEMTFTLAEIVFALVEMTFALVEMTVALVQMTFAPEEITVAPAALAPYLYKVMVTGPKSPAGISMFFVFLLQGYEVHV